MINNWANVGANSGPKFSDPFVLPSSNGFPTSPEESFTLSRFLWYLVPQFRAATMRLVSHFITDIDFVGNTGSIEERDELRKTLYDTLDLKGALRQAGACWGCSGNAFGRMHLPFDRYLIDMRGGSYRTWPVSMFRNMPQVTYNWERMTYTVPDPLDLKKRAGDGAKMIELEFFDRRVADPSRVKLIQLNPEFLLLEKAYQNDTVRITDRFDPEFIADVRNNRMHQINNTPRTILSAIKADAWLRYDEDEVFHLYDKPVPGITNSGWGLPPAIENYRSLQRLMVFQRIDEAVGKDYMLPFRVITPNPGAGISDSALKVMLGPWKSVMRKMIETRRKDEYAFHTAPFPLNYQEFAASGKQLSPKDHIDWHTDAMLNAMGYPAELFKGTMAIQQIPTAMRILEMNFQFLQHGMNMYCKWIARKFSDFMQRPYIEPELQNPRVADDLEQRGMYLQLISGGEIPRRVGYEKWGIKDPVEAAKERMREDMAIQRGQAELQEQAQREQQMGSMSAIVAQRMQQVTQPGSGSVAGGAPGGAPGGGSMVGNITPLDIMSQADAEAQRLLQMPEGQRFAELRKLEASNEPLHAAVKQRMEKIRSQGASAGRQNALQILSGG